MNARPGTLARAPARLSVLARLTARLRGGDAMAHALAVALRRARRRGHRPPRDGSCGRNSALARHAFGWAFLASQAWDPVAGQFGAAAFVYGTLMTSAIALVIAVPLGVGVAIFLAELAPPRLSASAGMLLELLAAIPSVIYGLIGVSVLVPVMRQYVQPGAEAGDRRSVPPCSAGRRTGSDC